MILTIVGVGLIGGSIGLAARRRGLAGRVLGVGRVAATLDAARRVGAIDEGCLDLVEGVRRAELVVFCTPVDLIAEQVITAGSVCRPGTLLTDAGSTKGAIVRAIDGRLPTGISFVGSHPLAGSEKRGPEHADADLFQGRVTVVTPTERTDRAALERTVTFWKALGSRVTIMDSDEHDRALALTSHLPHLLASALAGALPEELRELAATGFRDTTRIAAGDPSIWTGILLHNRAALLDALSGVEERLDEFKAALTAGNPAAVDALLTRERGTAMLWEIEIAPKGHDAERDRVVEDYNLLNSSRIGAKLITGSARGYLVEGSLSRSQAETLTRELLIDSLVEIGHTGSLNGIDTGPRLATILLKPGVMDPTALSVVDAARDLDIPVETVRSFRRYFGPVLAPGESAVLQKVLANDAIEQFVEGPLTVEHLTLGKPYTFRLATLSIRELDDDALMKCSRDGQLSLSLAEMRTIQTHFRGIGRDPTDVELETIAQTWSEHCSHKTLKGRVEFAGEGGTRGYQNLLKETIFAATQQLRQRFGADDWCVSVFEDNAGVVRFDDRHNVCFKVETHNRPSAIEPYGGASTGIGGVIRDVLGTGLGAKPICNTDVFCFAPPGLEPYSLPRGVLHPRKIIAGVVAGVRDYGNRMGIPTVNGAVCYDERYVANPLVFCGTVGVIPVDRCTKEAKPGDLIVAVGGRTGRDGIHGATFSSAGLTAESDIISGGAVQIGNAIAEKKMMDVLLQARDRGLYHAVTDCGAGGFSSAVGEMGEKTGALVQLDLAPLKYEGLSYTEIWISESQERMILAVPPDNWEMLKGLCKAEDVEATVIGKFEATGRLRLRYGEHSVADLDMHFLHDGRPPVVRQATWNPPAASPTQKGENRPAGDVLLAILSSPNVGSKEWIIRQYDHEVQGGSVIKPLVGLRDDGPSDASVVLPVAGSWTGLAIGCGLNPHYGDLDPYAMAAAVIDEAVRNVVAVGADPARVAILDNFCWGNTDRPEVLGSLVRAAEACRDVALAYGTPFISGKDSLKNEYQSGGRHIVIPPTLLISAMGRVPDVRRCVTMDLKEPGNVLFLVGTTRDEMGGSHYHLVTGRTGGVVPRPDLTLAPRIFAKLHEAIRTGLVRSCHDLSEGGLAVALAEMALAGGVGADVTGLATTASLPDDVLLYSESTTRFVIEVSPGQVAAVRACLADVPFFEIGRTTKEARLRIAGSNGEWIVWTQLADLQKAWQRPL